MLNFLGKNLHLCFSKFKSSDHTFPAELTSNTKSFKRLKDIASTSTSRSEDFFLSDSDSEDITTATNPPDFATVCASQRFFFSSPGLSNSIIGTKYTSEPVPHFAGGVPTTTFSPNPYADFRRSMQEMVDSRGSLNVAADWDWLHELLVCYLALNPKYTHKYIMDAYGDLVLSLMSSRRSDSYCRKSESVWKKLV